MHIWFTKDELALESESHAARRCTIWIFAMLLTHLIPMVGIYKIFTSKGVSPVLKLSFTIAEIPQDGVAGEDIHRDESLQIGMFVLRFFQ